MPRIKRVVQGSYISVEAKNALQREAKRNNTLPATYTSEVLEKEARRIIRREKCGIETHYLPR
jgi:hypothetical protein